MGVSFAAIQQQAISKLRTLRNGSVICSNTTASNIKIKDIKKWECHLQQYNSKQYQNKGH